MFTLTKIISGGQTGADQAGLKAAFDNGYKTGGFAPKGYITSDGPNRQLLQKKYSLTEYGEGYVPRTFENVRHSNGTIRMAIDFTSPGEQITLLGIEKYNKPYFDIDLNNTSPVSRLYEWLLEHNIKVLNVAGNTDGKHGRNIFKPCYEYLIEFFNYIKENT